MAAERKVSQDIGGSMQFLPEGMRFKPTLLRGRNPECKFTAEEIKQDIQPKERETMNVNITSGRQQPSVS
jgi:hypothetical protein